MRVLLVVANRSYGGAERHVADLSGELAARGHRVACLFPPESGLTARLASGVEGHEVAGLLAPPRFAVALLRVCRAFRPDLVHFHSPRAALMGRLVIGLLGALRRGRRPRVVSTAHGWIPTRLRLRRVYEVLYRITGPLDDATVAVSRDTAQKLGPRCRRLTVIPNGIRLRTAGEPSMEDHAEREAAVGDGRRVTRLGFVGRLTEEKGFPQALSWFAEVRRRLGERDMTLEVYGDGPLGPDARREASALAVKGVCFHGWISPDAIGEAMAGLTVLLMTSREEGLPYVLLEAMGAGCPVVSTRVGGLPEVIEHGRDGWLVTPGDAPTAAGIISMLALDGETARQAGVRAQRKISRAYRLEAMVDRTEDVYRAACSGITGHTKARTAHGSHS